LQLHTSIEDIPLLVDNCLREDSSESWMLLGWWKVWWRQRWNSWISADRKWILFITWTFIVILIIL